MSPLLFLLAGCPKEPEPVVPPTVEIVTPADGTVVANGDVSVVVEVTDFELVEPEAGARFTPPILWWAPTLAWAHEPGAEAAGYLQVSVDGDAVLDTSDLEFTLMAIASGEHTIEVELMYPDGDALFPAVTDEVAITVP